MTYSVVNISSQGTQKNQNKKAASWKKYRIEAEQNPVGKTIR